MSLNLPRARVFGLQARGPLPWGPASTSPGAVPGEKCSCQQSRDSGPRPWVPPLSLPRDDLLPLQLRLRPLTSSWGHPADAGRGHTGHDCAHRRRHGPRWWEQAGSPSHGASCPARGGGDIRPQAPRGHCPSGVGVGLRLILGQPVLSRSSRGTHAASRWVQDIPGCGAR